MTSYDTLFESFLVNCPNNDIPDNDEGKYAMIQNAVKIYNLKTKIYKDNLTYPIKGDDLMEELDCELTDYEILLFAHCLKLSHLKGQYTYFSQLFSSFSKEMGMKNYNAQVSGRLSDIKDTENVINELLETSIEDWEV